MNNIRSNDLNYGSAHFGKLSQQQCEKLHNASLEILERTGVRMFEPEAVNILKSAGAFISEGNRVRIPTSLVEKAFTTVPKRVTL
jgi:trimethylamine--corrinoid protein Co-methyltransferase